ncbi:Nitrogen regulatory protein PII [Rhodopirellula maiorica SM1]|uniref:Nitrogen regulatory protein PII n=1 Tax=Rhodopirellula maiorica SM1 TaxID=1265738 RepID=M5S5B7_9BACT|nr:P-II family nitrogen regulator [Rhodopirellula maiorica]EMI21379.1 Nitrogen regulatory protein PII [Rhodopirellula maiorica SM1]
MKKIEAIIRHFKLDTVKQALVDHGFGGMTVSEVKSYGDEVSQKEIYRGSHYEYDFIPNIKIEVVVGDHQLQTALDALLAAARMNAASDGDVLVTDIGEAIRIRTAEHGEVAL